MKDYDSFAPFYDLAMGDNSGVAQQIHRLIQKQLPAAKSLLEFGCGSGMLIKTLSQFYQCQGIDLSRKMIGEAKRKLVGVPLSVANMTTVNLSAKFDVVLCAFDTINHLSQFSEWKKVFDRAYAHLNPGGLFIFDINTEGKIARYHSEQAYAEIGAGLISIFDVQKTQGPRYTVTVRVLTQRKGQLYRLHEMEVHGATFPVERIKAALRKRFTRVSVVDLERVRVSSLSDELYFICRKSG